MNIGELAKFRGGIATDTISEQTAASGVTIDGVLCKDGGVSASGTVSVGTITEYTSGSGVTIDSVLCKDGSVTCAASGTVITTYVKAADTQGLALVNRSGTSVVTVSDAGAVTAGPAASANRNLIVNGAAKATRAIETYGANISDDASKGVFDYASSTTRFLSYGPSTTNAGTFAFRTRDVSPNTIDLEVASCTAAGAWTLGPSSLSSTLQHTVNGYYNGSGHVCSFKNLQSTNTGYIFIGGSSGQMQIGYQAAQVFIDGISGKTSSGGAAVYVNSSHLLGTSTSVREAKTNIKPLGSTIGWLKQLKPYVYQYRKQIDGEYTDEAEDFVNTGLIYDEVVQVNPQLCFDTADGKPSGVEYTRLITPMLKAIQEQQAMIEELKAEVAALKAK